MYAEERQQAMARSITQDGRLSVAQLAESFDVTTETVRRDLSSLERIGLVRRVHGGAVPASSLSVIESGIGERDQANTAAKDAIAEAALQQLPPPGSVVILDAGSTTARLAAILPRDHRLTVVTHAVPVAARLAGLPHIELHLLPGRVRPTTHAAVGPDTVAALQDLRADLAFLATNGISAELRAHHPRPRRGRHQAGDRGRRPAYGRARRLLQDRGRDLAAVRGDRRRRRPRHRQRIDDDDRRALEKAGLEVVVA